MSPWLSIGISTRTGGAGVAVELAVELGGGGGEGLDGGAGVDGAGVRAASDCCDTGNCPCCGGATLGGDERSGGGAGVDATVG